MADHYREDSYETDLGGAVWVRCACGWTSNRLRDERVGGVIDIATEEALDEQWEGHIHALRWPHVDQRLVFRHDRRHGPRHFLAGEPLSCGTPIEVQFPGGVWVRGRYEVEHDASRPGARVPMFYCQLGGPASDNGVLDHIPQVHFELPWDAVVRRPQVTEVRRAS